MIERWQTLKRISNKEEFIIWANAVNNCDNLDDKLLLQDIYGHSQYNLMKDLYCALSHAERELVDFSIYKAEGSYSLNSMMYGYMEHKVDEKISKYIEELNVYKQALETRQQDLDNSIGIINRRLREQRAEIESLKKSNGDLKSQCAQMSGDLKNHIADARKFRVMKSLIDGTESGLIISPSKRAAGQNFWI